MKEIIKQFLCDIGLHVPYLAKYNKIKCRKMWYASNLEIMKTRVVRIEMDKERGLK